MPVPTKFNSRFPLESFDPRYRDIWLKAALEEVTFTFPSEKEAQVFQMRLHMYRSKLRQSGHSDANIMYRAKTSRKANILRLRPADAAFEDTLAQFQVPASPVPPSPIPPSPALPKPTTPTTDEQAVSFEDLFRDFNLPTEGDSHND